VGQENKYMDFTESFYGLLYGQTAPNLATTAPTDFPYKVHINRFCGVYAKKYNTPMPRYIN
jgi:hypothetical protein